MMAILEDAGFTAVDVPELDEFQPGRDGVAVVLRSDSTDLGEPLEHVRDEYPAIPIIVSAPELDLGAFASMIRAGAAMAIDDHTDVDYYGVIVDAALKDRASVPRELLAALAARIPATPESSAWVTDTEAGWLVALAEGTTVADLANRDGYSEREMFRLLGNTYKRIGVENRTEAIIWATRHGLLDG